MIKNILKRYFGGLYSLTYQAKERLRLRIRRYQNDRRSRQIRRQELEASVGQEFAEVLRQEWKMRKTLVPGVPPPLHLTGRRKVSKVRIPNHAHPVFFRNNLSDVAVMEQIFHRKEYAGLELDSDARLIIDCGANIGCAAIYFLNRCPSAKVIAIEPDRENFELLKKNLQPYGDRVKLINAGVWPVSGGLTIQQATDGQSCAISVRASEPGETPDVDAITIDDVMGMAENCADLVKIDIEGSEIQLFDAPRIDWLSRVAMVAVEPHGPECETAIRKAMNLFNHRCRQSGEYLVFDAIQKRVPVGEWKRHSDATLEV